jgi:hypothetical protein
MDSAAGSRQLVPAMPDDRRKDRYAVRRDAVGWTVFTTFSGEPALVGGAPQTGLSEDDARHTANLLNSQSRRGDSSMRK